MFRFSRFPPSPCPTLGFLHSYIHSSSVTTLSSQGHGDAESIMETPDIRYNGLVLILLRLLLTS
ncbi:hypothetical protein AMELA_G00248390 [Ameiurus melas]|uniref:Uncharacterized protein n=1 Tax=Ameiurus melas TaxID=219545 RepID=A0A7J5ZW39_AMEME|nr:hypothetical protein AMELA_G00248390 [Ameiurus melas]